ncbi:MAG: hypothetical protein NT027_08570 [Proteobacteria bacterium]|nr:hypothetical protein [Pseudomonadota bacterium]
MSTRSKWVVFACCVIIPATLNSCRRRVPQSGTDNGDVGKLEDVTPAKPKRTLAEDQKCKTKFLKRLGWTIKNAKDDSEQNLGLVSGLCRQKDLPTAKAANLLTANISIASDESITKGLDQLIDSEATMCAYRMQLSAGLDTAINKLSKNTNFTFRRVSDPRHLPKEGILGTTASEMWETESAQMSMYVKPGVSPYKALSVFYDPKHNTYIDCYAGALSVATLAHMEMFGETHYDKAFKSNDVFLGVLFTTIDGIDGLGNPLEVKSWWTGDDGKEVPATGWYQDEFGVDSMKLGRHDFIARRGAVFSLMKEDFLDSVVDVNENFIVTQVTDKGQALLDDLVKQGRHLSEHFFGISTSYWIEESKKIIAAGGEKAVRQQAAIDQFYVLFPEAKKLNTVELAKKIDTDPAFTEILVFVHPLKIRNLSYHVKRLTTVNPRMPYSLKFRDLNYATTMFDRYKKYFLEACE